MPTPRIYRADAIVLKASDFGEADRALTLFTAEHGKIRAIAKGARRPGSRLGGPGDVLTHSQLRLAKSRIFVVVPQAHKPHAFLFLHAYLRRPRPAAHLVELCAPMTEEGPAEVP